MTTAKGYTEMKDSRADWIGKIPATWDVSKIGTLYTQRNEKVSDKDYPPLSVTMKGILPQLATAAKTDDGDNRKLVRVGDFAINSRSDRRGSCGISPYDGSVSLINTILVSRKKMHPGYYDWLFHTTLFADEFYKWGHGIVDDLWTTRWQEMKRILVPVPPYETQSAIAAYLDTQCAKIDEIIAQAKASIEDYKQWKASIIYEAVTKGLDPNVEMKDSGVEWVGMIPKHWTIIANKYVMHKEKRICEKWNGQDVLSLTMNGVIIRDILNPVGKMPTTFDGYQFAYAGELLMCLFDIDVTPRCVGRVFNDGVTSPAYSCFQLNNNADLGYFYYYYLMVDNTKELLHLAKNLRHSFTEEQLGQLKVPLPPLREQSAIASYLDTQCAKIDELVAKKQSLIDDLESYKKSLIYEVVTGKRRVY